MQAALKGFGVLGDIGIQKAVKDKLEKGMQAQPSAWMLAIASTAASSTPASASGARTGRFAAPAASVSPVARTWPHRSSVFEETT